MKVDGVKITWVSSHESVDQRDRCGYIHPCQYGPGWDDVQPNECGAIVRPVGNYVGTGIVGIWSRPVEVLERIFIVEPA